MATFASGARARAATYHISNLGDDAHDGLTEETAWRSLAAAEERARPGDTILLRRGDAFRESANFAGGEEQDPTGDLTIGAYGPPDEPNPVISGALAITGWEPWRDGIYVATVDRPVEHLFADGRLMTIARYPDEDWLQVHAMSTAEDGTETIYLPELVDHPRNEADYWVGAQVRWRRWSWWHETREILAYDGEGTVTLAAEGARGRESVGSMCYIDNKLEELDAPGEWYFDEHEMRVYFLPPEGRDPNRMSIEGSHRVEGLRVTDSVVEDITFRHQTERGLNIEGASRVERCRFEGVNGVGLNATWGVGNAVVRDCVFEHCINNGIVWNENPEQDSHSVIERNTFIETGTVAGYESPAGWYAVAIALYNGSGVRIRHNRIDGTGYSGMFIGSPGHYIEYNVISRALLTLNDGGGIYTNSDRNYIRGNIVTEVYGNTDTSQRILLGDRTCLDNSLPWANLGHGIWLEFLGDFRGSIVEDNICANNRGFGLFLPNNFGTIVRGNVFYGNERAQMDLSGRATYERTGRTENVPQEHTITGNVFFATERGARPFFAPEGQGTLRFGPDIHYGRLFGNYFAHPDTAAMVQEGRDSLTVAQWQERFDWADPAPVVLGPDELAPGGAELTSKLLLNDSAEFRDEDPGEGIWRDLEGRIITGPVTLPPYTSKVLVRCLPGQIVPQSRHFDAAGGIGWFHVAQPAPEVVEAQLDADWVEVSEPRPADAGAVRYLVMPNRTDEERSAVLTVGDAEHSITQAAAH